MNADLLSFLNTDLQFIKGVGPILAARMDDLLGGRTVRHFLLHKPSYVRPRSTAEAIANAAPGEILTIAVQVVQHKPAGSFRGRRTPTQIICKDKLGGTLTLQFFGTSFLDYWLQKLPVGEWRIVSGKMDTGRYGATINHPDFIERLEDSAKIPAFQAVYPISTGLTQKIMTNARDAIFEKLPETDTDNEFWKAIRAIHHPQTNEDLSAGARALQTLAYSELFSHQIEIATTRARRKRGIAGHSIPGDGTLRAKLLAALPFKLTRAQDAALGEIDNDMARPEPMMRLVQGDVGSGKTIVALLAMLNAAESKFQSVLLAPTDALAQQHFAKIKPLCDKLGVVCEILTGRDKGKIQKEKLLSLRSGLARIIIGTHALFQDAVEYKNLGLIIIDEQHRFGVAQRGAMAAKGNRPDLLALSATPIPRTLSMTMYGDMDISIINEKPAGRLPIKTTKLGVSMIANLTERLRLQITAGAKVFWVCPFVAESEDNAAAAITRAEYLKANMPDGIVGLVHGQMDKKERDRVMADFADPNGEIKLLVATSVIEVGIDVPAATIMVIENAERFGLSALHQLRGRVGRGSGQSFCVLMFGYGITEDGQKRLQILCETDDGFAIAEQDLMMRGVGELMGTKQSGWIPYYFVDYREHRDLFKLAQIRAMELAESDPKLDSEELVEGIGLSAKDLMYIFDRTAEVRG
ncbi:MAG: ATP-dependent DNA helicase RecG [Rickettsiales bacterium]|jgi:ATP-dependent DNA helicase RecG|nr:ATP-dependent DNA helicase RecG [Rickettsiales bacterium]